MTPEAQRTSLIAKLETAESVGAVLDGLVDGLGLTQAELAEGGGVSAEAARRWLRRASAPQGASYKRIGQVRSTVLRLGGRTQRTVEGMRLWLTFEHPDLGESPLAAIGNGRAHRVRRLLD